MQSTKYPLGSESLRERYPEIEVTPVMGHLSPTDRTVKPVGSSVRKIWEDAAGQLWVKIKGLYWQFPDEIEY